MSSSTPSPSPSRNNGERDKESRWYFTAEQLANSPSRQNGITADLELSYRQQTAYLIQDMGQRLQVSQLCINTAIVYMHRFYAFHSFTHFHRNSIAAASLFLAAKVEEQPRKLEHVIRAANKCLNHVTSATTDTHYIEQAQDLVFNENVLLQTLGFDVAIDHPHTHVVKTCQLVKACKDLAQTSYFLASNSLHLTSMCLQYKPTIVACFCIYLACKWSRWEIAQSTEGKHWFHYVDETVTMDLLKQLTDEFIAIYEKSPARLKSKLNNIKAIAQRNQTQVKDKKAEHDWKMSDMMKMYSPGENQTNSSQYTTTPTTIANQTHPSCEQQSQSSAQTIPATMLPPQPHQSQSTRKSEAHRSHHSSSAPSAHHPSKMGLSTVDALDLKPNSHKQQHQQQQQPPPIYPNNNNNNLVSRSRDNPSVQHSNQNIAVSSSKREAVNRSSIPTNLVGQNMSRSQNHPFDPNYHKSRERNLSGTMILPNHAVPSHGMPSRKVDASRSVNTKEATNARLSSEHLSKAGISGNKMYPMTTSTSSSSSMQFANANSQQMYTNTKVDAMHDMPRNVMHSNRVYNSNVTTNAAINGPTPLLLNYQSQMTRHNMKHEQSKQMSVHTQQQSQVSQASHQHSFQQQQQHHHHHHHQHNNTNKTLIKADATLIANSGGMSDSQPQVNAQYNNLRPSSVDSTMSHSDDHAPSQFNTHLSINNSNSESNGGIQSQNMKSSTTTTTTTTNSTFSPDWLEKSQKQQHPQPANTHQMQTNSNNYNGAMSSTPNSDIYNYKAASMNSASSVMNAKQNSPAKLTKSDQREQIFRKDNKNRSESNAMLARLNTTQPATTITTQAFIKNSAKLKHESTPTALLLPNELAAGTNSYNNLSTNATGTKTSSSSQLKRASDQLNNRHEEDSLRDTKVRKYENTIEMSKHPVVNGIETNPDMVRNLLKESLCSTSGLLKTQSLTPSLQPPAELLEPSTSAAAAAPAAPASTNSISTLAAISGNHYSMNTTTIKTSTAMTVNQSEFNNNSKIGNTTGIDDQVITAIGGCGKSEKKKKKDKHKHKEKDKTKDREERKKHKKDKDRHKDRDMMMDGGGAGIAEHVKIKISKEKLENSAGEPIGLKIKIPKDIIGGDLSSNNNINMNSNSNSNNNNNNNNNINNSKNNNNTISINNSIGLNNNAISSEMHMAQPLKIKISKDKLDSYSSGSCSGNDTTPNNYHHQQQPQHHHQQHQQQQHHHHNHHIYQHQYQQQQLQHIGHNKSITGNYLSHNSNNQGHHLNSNNTVNSFKRKERDHRDRDRDRDREREREKDKEREKRRNHDASITPSSSVSSMKSTASSATPSIATTMVITAITTSSLTSTVLVNNNGNNSISNKSNCVTVSTSRRGSGESGNNSGNSGNSSSNSSLSQHNLGNPVTILANIPENDNSTNINTNASNVLSLVKATAQRTPYCNKMHHHINNMSQLFGESNDDDDDEDNDNDDDNNGNVVKDY